MMCGQGRGRTADLPLFRQNNRPGRGRSRSVDGGGRACGAGVGGPCCCPRCCQVGSSDGKPTRIAVVYRRFAVRDHPPMLTCNCHLADSSFCYARVVISSCPNLSLPHDGGPIGPGTHYIGVNRELLFGRAISHRDLLVGPSLTRDDVPNPSANPAGLSSTNEVSSFRAHRWSG
jgi:hypothetical protein